MHEIFKSIPFSSIRINLIHFFCNFLFAGPNQIFKKDTFHEMQIRPFHTPKFHFLNQELKEITEWEITGGRSGGLGAGGCISGGITALGHAKPLCGVNAEALKQLLVVQKIAQACGLLNRRVSQRPTTSLWRRRCRVQVAGARCETRRARRHVLPPHHCSGQGGDRDEES